MRLQNKNKKNTKNKNKNVLSIFHQKQKTFTPSLLFFFLCPPPSLLPGP